MARLTTDFFISQLIRRVTGEGGFAAVVKKGAIEAGAVFIVVRERSGTIRFFGPASQHVYEDQTPTDRWFAPIKTVTTDEDVASFSQRETRFDPDFWLLELELHKDDADLPFHITTP